MKSIAAAAIATTTAALNLKVNHQMRTIEMIKTFADKASRFGSDEYNTLMLAREQNPGYSVKVATRKTTKSDKPAYKGLTYEYMEKYILAHDDENHKIMNEYLELRAMTDEAEDALLESATYQEMKDWFLDKFPEIAKFHQKRGWAGEISAEGIYFVGDERIVIITYAKFGSLLEQMPDFHTHFDYIICDELHNLLEFQFFAAQPNLHSVARRGLERAVRNDRSTVIALTATPRRVHDKFNAPYYDVPIDSSDLIHYETKQIIRYTNLDYLISTMDKADTGLCYVTRITTMLSVEATAREHGLHPICIWSISNKDYDMSEEQLRVRQNILENFSIPNEYNLVIINASSETSLKIKSPVDYVIVHSGDDDTQVVLIGGTAGVAVYCHRDSLLSNKRSVGFP